MLAHIRDILRRRGALDLDRVADPRSNTILEIDARSPSSLRISVLALLRQILRQAVKDCAVALAFAYDRDDRCLRMTYYLAADPRRTKGWYELVPAPEVFASPVLARLSTMLRVVPGETLGRIAYRWCGQWREATGRRLGEGLFVVYFGEEHPAPPFTINGKKAGRLCDYH